jgi:hypothetical protein
MRRWLNTQDPTTARERSRSLGFGQPGDTDARRVSMRQSEPVEVDGVFLGVAVEHELGVRFIAVDRRVTDMDQSIWPTIQYARSSARQLYKSSRVGPPFT